jgi:hypothetical protein
MASEVIPFGKYKGQPVEAMAADQQYIEWLMGQSWFRDKYQNIYTLIVNNFAEPSETPEHNALQAMFLDGGVCMSVARDAGVLCKIWDRNYERLTGLLEEYRERRGKNKTRLDEAARRRADFDKRVALGALREDLWEAESARHNHNNLLAEIAREEESIADIEAFIGGDKPPSVWVSGFETDGWDVVIVISSGGYSTDTVLVELKPSLGDDYPSVLRQMKANSTRAMKHGYGNVHCVLVIGGFCAAGATLDQVRRIFAMSGFPVVQIG